MPVHANGPTSRRENRNALEPVTADLAAQGLVLRNAQGAYAADSAKV
jgi:hypothetical protein